ncbi:LexA family transcriptional regulator [Marinitoga sp. 1137]|uniref:LexA family protein n=1 Tax=Marinitoga sp. 1137 TaxID=1545835 RepID=UPI000953471B|nr:LexA family transcriptional regulator [Marinitoga sp. 1137]
MAFMHDWEQIGKKIKEIRQSKNITAEDLAQEIGTSISTIFRIENGQEPRALNLAKLAKALDISLDNLLGLDNSKDKISDNVSMVKFIPVIKNLFKYIENNFVLEEDNIITQIPVPVNKNIDFGIEIQDDSMIPRFHIKDIALIKRQNLLNNNDFGAFAYNNYFLIRKFYQVDSVIHLVALNSDYEPIIIPKYKKKELKILGKVVGKISWIENDE